MIYAIIGLGLLCVLGLGMILAEIWYNELWHGWDKDD